MNFQKEPAGGHGDALPRFCSVTSQMSHESWFRCMGLESSAPALSNDIGCDRADRSAIRSLCDYTESSPFARLRQAHRAERAEPGEA